jgi:hypothetical protein
MSDIVDPLVMLEEALPQLQGAVDQQDLGQALVAASTACTDMPLRIQRLNALSATLALLPNYLKQRAADIREANETILDLGETMDGAETVDDLESIAREARKLDPSLGALHRSALNLAEAYARDHIAPLSALERLLHRLGRTEVATAVGELRRMDSGLASAGLQLPTKLAALQEAREALARDLTTLASDPEVDAFLTGFAKNGSVTLTLVTKTVLDWLGEQSALDQFTVQPID